MIPSMNAQQRSALDPRLGGGSNAQSPDDTSRNVSQQSPAPYYHHQYPASAAVNASTQLQQATGTDRNSVDQTSPAQLRDQSPADGSASLEDDSKRPRACESCRGLKVRCDQDPDHPELPCKRCAKARRECIITQPSRKRQKKSDTRVAELEKKLDALTAALNNQQHTGLGRHAPDQTPVSRSESQPKHGRTSSTHHYADERLPQSEGYSKRRRLDEASYETPTLDGADLMVTPSMSRYASQRAESKDDERISREFNQINDAWRPNADVRRFLSPNSPEDFAKRMDSLIDPKLASTIFDRYVTQLAPHLPAVVFPPTTTAEQVWKEKPILYTCVLSASSSASSSGTLAPDVSKQLAYEAVGAIADCVVRNGAKSLELIQAMQVMALWYKPPEKAEQTNFYQIIHMSAVMALDIGLGKRFNPAKARRGFGDSNAHYAPGPHLTLPQDSDTLEARRAWLCCYYLCASASMVLRRPNLIRWTNYMKECIEVLETHPDAPASDKFFCQHVKIQHICENIGLQFMMDDSTATVSIKDPKVTYALNVLENDLKQWKEQIPPECRSRGLEFFEHVTSLYLHEIALHFNHNIEDFKLPFTEASLKSVHNTSDKLTQHQMAALEACVAAAHGILDTMLAYDMQVVKALPMLIFFVRCCYAIVILIKMHVAVTTPGSEVGKIVDADNLRVDYYMNGLMRLFGNDLERDPFGPHPKVLRILSVLRDWFAKHKENVTQQQSLSSVMAPMASRREAQPSAQQSRAHNNPRSQTSPKVPSELSLDDQSRRQSQNTLRSEGQGWTVSTPYVMNYGNLPPKSHPDSRMPIHRESDRQRADPYSSAPPQPDTYTDAGDQLLGVDPANPGPYGWGSGFEQAMDITMGGMDGLSGGGLDGWFLGDSMAPFGLNGEMTSTAQW